MIERIKAIFAENVDPNHSEDGEIYVPFDVSVDYDPDYENDIDDPEDFEELGDIPSEEVEGK